jgi:anti-repressor protein
MDQLIKIQTNEYGEQLVSARELHLFLEVKTEFKDWMPRMLDYGFEEKKDFSSFLSESTGGRPSKEYVLTIDTAKEISMIQRSNKGKEARRYFLECEKLLKQKLVPSYQIEDPIERAKKWIEEQKKVLLLEEENKKLQFRSDFVDVVFESDGLFSMEEVAKVLKLPFGRNTMLRKLREQKVFLESNTPKQNLINSGYFKVSEQIIDSGKFKKLVCTTYATSKGIGYIHKIFKNLEVIKS